MVKRISPHLDILPEPQLRLWDELDQIPQSFVLYGGTALALHLGHRQSVDFDFFADTPINPTDLLSSLPFLHNAQITQQQPNTLTCLVDRSGPVKVSFFGLPNLVRIRAAHVAPGNGLRIADLLDLAGTKASVVQQRAQAKDYVDIDALITQAGIDLPTHLAAARLIFGPSFAPTATLKALAHFGDGDLPTLPDDVKFRLARAAASVDPLRLPSLKRTARRQPREDRDR